MESEDTETLVHMDTSASTCNVAFVTNYYPLNLTQKPGLTKFYKHMSDIIPTPTIGNF